jgi:hypothetical protein
VKSAAGGFGCLFVFPLAAVSFSRSDESERTALAERVAGSTRRCAGDEALARREALQALYCHATGEALWPAGR